MMENKKVLAIIPARSGSKGLKNKNILPMNGKPLLAWPITTALNSKYIDTVVLSTDDVKYAEIGLEYGATVPYLRPPELAGDKVASIDVILDIVNHYERQHKYYDFVVLLEPTSPNTSSEDVDLAIETLIKTSVASSIVGITKSEGSHPMFSYTLLSDNILKPLINKTGLAIRRQDIDDVFFLDGSLYVSETAALKKYNSFYSDYTIGMEFPKWKSFEVDDEVDFAIVEMLMRKFSNVQL